MNIVHAVLANVVNAAYGVAHWGDGLEAQSLYIAGHLMRPIRKLAAT